jgi:hypothetical protein
MIIIVNVLYCIAPQFVDLRHMSISCLQRSAFDGAFLAWQATSKSNRFQAGRVPADIRDEANKRNIRSPNVGNLMF